MHFRNLAEKRNAGRRVQQRAIDTVPGTGRYCAATAPRGTFRISPVVPSPRRHARRPVNVTKA